MRNLRRSNREEEEEESVFVPMTDMTVSFLFILMILLAFFAVRFSDKDTVSRAEYDLVKLQRDDLTVERDKLIIERDNLLAEIERLKREIERLLAKIKDLEGENADLREQIRERDERIKELLAEIEELQRKLNEQNPLEAYIAMAQVQRLEILRRIEEALKIEFKDQILVEISTENDALRFKGEGLFAIKSHTLADDKRKIVEKLAKITADAIACFTVNSQPVNYSDCNPNGIIIEAIQIEGHADSVGEFEKNIALSALRSQAAFSAMFKAQPNLLDYRNIRDQPVISLSAYGNMRPVTRKFDPINGEPENRRIDLRLIMYTPRDSEQVERIQQQIRDGLRLVVEEAASSGP